MKWLISTFLTCAAIFDKCSALVCLNPHHIHGHRYSGDATVANQCVHLRTGWEYGMIDESRRSLFAKAALSISPAFLTLIVAPQVAMADDSHSTVLQAAKKPWAPTEALLPATRVRLLLNRSIALADELASFSSTATGISTNEKARIEEILEQLGSILVPPTSASDLKPNKSIRLAFNTYTAYLRYDEKFTLNGSPSERKKLIREDRIPDVKQVITADLDLRDLYRNQVLTNVDEARAELRYQMDEGAKGNGVDGEELLRLLNAAGNACDEWFNLISIDDIKEAMEIVLGTADGVANEMYGKDAQEK